MCLKFIFRKYVKNYDYRQPFECSCDLCGKNFENMETFIKHIGSHDIRDINARLNARYGVVRCNTCFHTFDTVYTMSSHPCIVRPSVTPDNSVNSLESVVTN